VSLVDGAVANASASADEIKIKRGARFSPRDLRQIEFHEGQVHAATALNGRAQPMMAFLGVPIPRSTSTQEGLAVLTEFLTRSTSLPRVRRISDRVLAIQQAEEGATFLDVYRFFLARGNDPGAAFDGARRVFRGGVLEGGAPFTKDVCYLDGLLRVTNFLRVALVKGHLEYVPLFFAGKIEIEDVPLLVFTEAMRDVDLFVGVTSIGTDPEWLDRGEGRRFATYWNDYSFGDLSAAGEIRRDVLAQLLPRLAIADRCDLEDRFLTVRGDVRTYRIHLGSGNVLMSPNDQYLCIVAARDARADKLFLPFDDDPVLSLILSKAFLLANDAAIKDSTITSQIKRG
jgi:hypothetical protein